MFRVYTKVRFRSSRAAVDPVVSQYMHCRPGYGYGALGISPPTS